MAYIKVSDDLIAMPGYVHVRKDRADAQRGGGLCMHLPKKFH